MPERRDDEESKAGKRQYRVLQAADDASEGGQGVGLLDETFQSLAEELTGHFLLAETAGEYDPDLGIDFA